MRISIRGGFPLLCNFYLRTHVNFTRVNKIRAMYGKLHVNVKVEPSSTFTFTGGVLTENGTLHIMVEARSPECIRNC